KLAGKLPKDVIADVQGEKIECNLLSLCARSHYFAALVSGAFKEGGVLRAEHTLKVQDVSLEVFKEVNHILYFGTWNLLPAFDKKKFDAFVIYLDFTGTTNAVIELLK